MALSSVTDKNGYEVTLNLQKRNILLGKGDYPSDMIWWLNSMGFVYLKRIGKVIRKMIIGLTRKPQPFINF